MLQEYPKDISTDTVEDLYNEIEHLIDVPFEKFSKDVQQYQIPDNNNPYPNATQPESFERPILIESDSDEVEEDPALFEQNYTTCYKCNRIIPVESSNSLQVGNQNACSDCLSKKRTRSRSFTLENNVFSLVADKLKSIGSSSSNVSLLSPSTAKMDRRKSMPSMNDSYSQSMLAPSPTPSRPSSRASSFIEDVKQFLSPLSRKSSRNSMLQDYQQDASFPNAPSRKTSHNSLLDAINICKPKQRQASPSYERRIIDDNSWVQEDDEVMGIHQKHQELQATQLVQHIPIRRKQIKQIESRQERIDIYNRAYMDCMQTETSLVPWIIKQTQKGPPDDWFGYTPPARIPKKFMGIFKRKSKPKDNRAMQLQLGDDLLNRSTPLLHHRYSNSNLSVSPSFYTDGAHQELAYSPTALTQEEYGEGDYFDGYHDQYAEPSLMSPCEAISPDSDKLASPLTPGSGRPSSAIQPVSILKKSSRQQQHQEQQDYEYDNYYQDTVPYDDNDVEDNDYYHQDVVFDDDEIDHYEQSVTNASRNNHFNRQISSSSITLDKQQRLYSNSGSRYMMNEQNYHHNLMEPPQRRGSSRSHHRTAAPVPAPYFEDPYCDPPARRQHRSSRHYEDYEAVNDEYYQQQPAPLARKRSSQRKQRNQHTNSQDYYGMSMKMTPFMMEEWEMTLDELCEEFPRLDRHYINDFLRSAQGDFITAKEMIMEMIMELR